MVEALLLCPEPDTMLGVDVDQRGPVQRAWVRPAGRRIGDVPMGLFASSDMLPAVICIRCGQVMRPTRTIPRLGIIPQLDVFVCPDCAEVRAKEARGTPARR
jgi:hypothetical protein